MNKYCEINGDQGVGLFYLLLGMIIKRMNLLLPG